MKNKGKKTNIIILIVVVASLIGLQMWITHDEFIPDQLVESYDSHVTKKIDNQFLIFGYLKDDDRLTLTTYFLNDSKTSIISSLETTYGTIVFHDNVSEDVEVDKAILMQYGFNSHMEVNIIIRTTKNYLPYIESNDFIFSYIDNFDDYDYYIASYYGKTKDRDDLTYIINGIRYDLVN